LVKAIYIEIVQNDSLYTGTRPKDVLSAAINTPLVLLNRRNAGSLSTATGLYRTWLRGEEERRKSGGE
jgi:hypothetical protein